MCVFVLFFFRLIAPGSRETDEIARRLQIQKVQGNVVIHRPEPEQPKSLKSSENKLLKVKLPTTKALHPDNDETTINITCNAAQK